VSGRLRVGLDASGATTYYAAVTLDKGRPVLIAAGGLKPGEAMPRALAGAETHVALRAGEALVIALPGVAIEEAEEAFRWEVAKSGAVGADALRSVHRRSGGVDSGPPFLGVAADGGAAEARSRRARDLGLAPVAVTIEAAAIERLLLLCGKTPARGTVIHVDVREGTSIVSAFGGAGLALRRSIRTQPVSADSLAIDIQRSASYGERKLQLPAADSVYLSGDAVTPELVAEVARGLPGIAVQALDPFTAVDLGPRVEPEALAAIGLALVLPIALALVDDPVPDFIPPVERGARTIRRWTRRARVAAIALAPLVLACGLLVHKGLAPAEAALARAEARHARVELLQKRNDELLAVKTKCVAWAQALRQLGEREQPLSDLMVRLLAEIPDEAFLSELDFKGHYAGDADARGREGELDLRVRGELRSDDPSKLAAAREALRKSAQEIAPTTQVVFEVARKVGDLNSVGFSMDGVIKPGAPGAPAAGARQP
jgi:hypothetical protein